MAIGRECGVAGRTAWEYGQALRLAPELLEAKGKRMIRRRGDEVGEVLTAEVVREWVWGERLRLEEIAERVGCTHTAAKRWIERRVAVEYVGQPTQTERRWGELKAGALEWCREDGDDGRGGWLAGVMFGCSESLLLQCRELARGADRTGRAECARCGFWRPREELQDGHCEWCRADITRRRRAGYEEGGKTCLD